MFYDKIGLDGLVLFLGEGNFSFSASVVNKTNSEGNTSNIYASCFEKQIDINGGAYDIESNTEKIKNINYLESNGCNVLHGLDAESLHIDERLKGLKFSKIIFMFPHVGGKMKIGRNRKLILNVLLSAKRILMPHDGQVIITLCKGQGGTPFEKVKRIPADTWKIVEIAHEAEFVLSDVCYFPHDAFDQYFRVGYRDLQKGFNVDYSVVHTLEMSAPLEIYPISNLEVSLETERHSTNLPVSLYPPRYIHHISFWTPEDFDENRLALAIKASVGQYLLGWKTIDNYTNESGRRSRTIELEYCDNLRAMGPSRAIFLNNTVLRLSLEKCLYLEMR